MSRKFFAPFVTVSFSLVILAIAVLNLHQSPSGIFDQSAPGYFIKPVELNHLYVVEPDMEGYISSQKPTPDLEEVLYQSLQELKQRYVIDKAEIFQTERKGVEIPTLHVYVHPNQSLKATVNDHQAT